jgi:hypothetical protein
MHNISEMLNSKKEGKVKAKEQKTNKGCTRLKTRGSAKVRRECKNNKSSTLRDLYGMSERSVKSRSIERPFRAQEADFIGLVESKVRSGMTLKADAWITSSEPGREVPIVHNLPFRLDPTGHLPLQCLGTFQWNPMVRIGYTSNRNGRSLSSVLYIVL